MDNNTFHLHLVRPKIFIYVRQIILTTLHDAPQKDDCQEDNVNELKINYKLEKFEICTLYPRNKTVSSLNRNSGSSALNSGAVFLHFFTVAFLLFLTTAVGNHEHLTNVT